MEQIDFQGHIHMRSYFERWSYTILIDNKVLRFQVGISLSKNNSHSFIEVYESINQASHYFPFSKKEFFYCKNPFEIHIQKNFFSKKKIHLDLESKNFKLKGDFLLSPLYQHSSHFLNSIFYDWHHRFLGNFYISGNLILNRKKRLFHSCIGCIKKEYGKTYPKKIFQLASFNSNFHATFYLMKKDCFLFSNTTATIQVGSNFYSFKSFEIHKLSPYSWEIQFKKRKVICKATIQFKSLSFEISPRDGKMQDFFPFYYVEITISLISKNIIILNKQPFYGILKIT